MSGCRTICKIKSCYCKPEWKWPQSQSESAAECLISRLELAGYLLNNGDGVMVGWESNAGGKKEKKFSCKPSCQRNFLAPVGLMTGSRPRLPLWSLCVVFQIKFKMKFHSSAALPFIPLHVMQIIFQVIIKPMLKVTFALLAFAN